MAQFTKGAHNNRRRPVAKCGTQGKADTRARKEIEKNNRKEKNLGLLRTLSQLGDNVDHVLQLELGLVHVDVAIQRAPARTRESGA